jgi:peptidoglycan/LPS O-acetylase OafA/YrhL
MNPRIRALDGVRALAVLAVLAAHAGIPELSGGFIGVDIFFVLSGFLITSLLVDERNATGRLDLGRFWARRARRLLPGALLMITAVVVARPLLPPETVGTLRGDALSAALWTSNWRWALAGTDYFAQGGTASPLQHTWSLAVEEQFYLVWPVVLLALWWAVSRDGDRRRRLFVVASTGAVLSAVVTTVLSTRVPAGRVYFGTDVRAQELLIGAGLAAALAPTWRAGPSRRRGQKPIQRAARRPLPVLMTAGGLTVLALMVHRADGSPTEFRDGLLTGVALATAALLAGVILDPHSGLSALLASRPLVAIGRMSYGIYLWHWPVFEVVNGARTGLGPYPLAALRLTVTLAFAAVSLVLVELPVQRVRVPPRAVLRVAAAGVIAVVVVTFVVVPAGQGPPRLAALDQPPIDGTVPPPAAPAAPVASAPTAATSTAATSTASTATVAGATIAKSSAPAPKPTVASSTPAPGHPIVVDVFGDSIAWTLVRYLPTITNVTINNHTTLGCGLVDGGPYRYFGAQYPDDAQCDGAPDRWRTEVAADHPDEVLLIVGRWETMDRMYDGSWTQVGRPDFDTHLTALLNDGIDALASTGARVLVTTEPYNRRGEQPDGELYPEDQPERVDSWNRLLSPVVAAHPAATLLDLNHVLDPDGKFTWTVDGITVRSDGVHLTPDGVRWLTPWLAGQFRSAANGHN